MAGKHRTPSGEKEDGKEKWRIRRGYAPWVVASLIGAAAPLLLYFLYTSWPAVRPIIAFGQDGPIEPEYRPDGVVKLPVFGFPLAGAYLSFLLSAMLIYWIAGAVLSLRRGPPHDAEAETMPAHLTPAISSLLFTIPLLSAAWALNAKAGRFPDFPWEIFGENGGPVKTLFVFRKVMEISLFFPQLSAALSVMSLVIKPSRAAVILGSTALAAFLAMALWLNLLGK